MSAADPLVRWLIAVEAVGRAQLRAAGCTAPPSDALPPDPQVAWTAGVDRSRAVAAAADVPPVEDDLATALSCLGSAPELLLMLGADDRVIPVGGRTSYGLPAIEPHPTVRLSSCTVTPPDAEVVRVVDSWRQRQLTQILRTRRAPVPEALHASVADSIAEMLGLGPDGADRVLLIPSGTEAEAVLTALHAGADGRPVLNLFLGAKEAGRGSLPAADGHLPTLSSAFGPRTAVTRRLAEYDGIAPRIVDVDLRDNSGRARRAFDIEAEMDAHVDDAIEGGARALVHLMEVSKTGLRQPTLGWVAECRGRHPEQLSFVVDAAQFRTDPARLRSFLAAGASVMITGSKQLGGPPFCAALILADDLLTRAGALMSLPAGLRELLSRADLPRPLRHLGPEWQPVNWGLQARWIAAVNEWRSLHEVPADVRDGIRQALLDELTSGLIETTGVHLVDTAGAEPSIVAFTVAGPDGSARDIRWAREAYHRVVEQPGIQIGAPVELSPNGPAALRFAVGAPNVTRLALNEQPVSAARLMAQQAIAAIAEVAALSQRGVQAKRSPAPVTVLGPPAARSPEPAPQPTVHSTESEASADGP